MTSIPKLLKPRKEAEALIRNQMHRGKVAMQSKAPDEESAIAKIVAWDEATREVLLSLFDSSELADEISGADISESLRMAMGSELNCAQGRTTFRIKLLGDIIERLPEYEEPATEVVLSDFWSLIHPGIVAVTKSRFESNHHADAAETAMKHINEYLKEIVKQATGNEYDGADLMRRAFSVNNPVIRVDDLSTDSGKSTQQGFMELFVGGILGIRNPKAHGVITITRERAIHFIFFASMLMDTIDMAYQRYQPRT